MGDKRERGGNVPTSTWGAVAAEATTLCGPVSGAGADITGSGLGPNRR